MEQLLAQMGNDINDEGVKEVKAFLVGVVRYALCGLTDASFFFKPDHQTSEAIDSIEKVFKAAAEYFQLIYFEESITFPDGTETIMAAIEKPSDYGNKGKILFAQAFQSIG